ncbi:MAG: MSHA biogenesis protein MshJ, partial [Proteobacteria bacterium]|nr:MSHA biogenesis protein MshJ [Pseudomonadota bacterium]
KHGIELTLQGSYLDVLRYLAAIENIGVRFFWERVEYQVEQYPLGEVSIEVFTLSTQEQLLDV